MDSRHKPLRNFSKIHSRAAKYLYHNEISNAVKEHKSMPVVSTQAVVSTPRLAKTYCSQCGREFGPGDQGFSDCENHTPQKLLERRIAASAAVQPEHPAAAKTATSKLKPLNRATAMKVKISRCREFLEFLIRKFDVRCYVCGGKIDHKEFNKWRDEVTILHEDYDRENGAIENLEICHRGCYKKHTAHTRRPGDFIGVQTNETH